ncbi:hypothetical protein HHI36_012862 [Cryptolaemus montrouzieri]|uniref:Flagellar hook-length control protein FliK n=1 Tax=Cryptolaemus montrouzieri TaxID=559131 RepID=A0ABD2NGF8_9CUCU
MFEEPLDLLPSSTNTPSQEYSTSSIVENKSSTEWQETTTNPEIENGSTEAPFSKTNAAISNRSNQIRKEIIPNSSHRPTTKEEIFATSFIRTGAAVQQSSQEPSVEVTSISSPSISIEFSESQTFLPEAEIALDLSNYTLLSSESFFNESETSSESIESRIEPHISSESLYSTFSNWKNNNIAAESKRNSKSKLFTSPLNRFSELNARTNKETSKNPIIPKEQLSSTLPSTGYVHIKTEPNYLKNNFAFRNAHFSSQNKPYGVQEASQNTQIVEGESTTIAYSTEYSTILKGIQDNLIPEHVKARINPKNIPQLLTNSGTITSENSSSEEVIDLDLTQKDFESVKKLSEILRDLLADLAEKPNSNVELEVAIKPQPPTTKEHINTDWHEIENFIRSNLYSIVRDVSNVIKSDLISHHGLQLNFTINTPMQLRKEFEENFSDSIKIILSKLFPKRGFLVTASKEDYSNVPAVSVNIFVSPSKLINAPLINLDKSKNLTSKVAQFLFKALNSKERQNEHDRIIDFAFATKNVVLLNFEELESLVIEVLKSKNIEGKAIAKYATLEIRKDGEIIIHMPFEIDSKLSKTDFKHQREEHSTKAQSEDRLKKVVLESLQRNDYEHPLERISDLLLLNK